MIRTVRATRYVTPLREGGSLPAVIEADDDGTYVLKFTGAGQGPLALVAELVAGEIGRAIGLPIPELVFVDLDPQIARSEPDSEIQQLVQSSAGLNLAMDFLPGSFAYDPIVGPHPDSQLASDIVVFDWLMMNMDRTARNTNMLVWHKRLWLIDHGAALYLQHTWRSGGDRLSRAADRFPSVKQHVLLPRANELQAATDRIGRALIDDVILSVTQQIPESWLADIPGDGTARGAGGVYFDFIRARRDALAIAAEEVASGRTVLL